MREVKKQHESRVEAFLNLYPNKYTRKNYYGGLYDFFCVVFGETSFKESKQKHKWIEAQGDLYFSEKRDYEKDIEAFAIALNGRAPKTVRLKLVTAKLFLLENGVELPQKFWRKIRRRTKGSRALTFDRIPSNEEIRKIMMHLPVQGRALFLILESSGMRIGEALQLKKDDVDLSRTPMRIEVLGEYTKTGNPRIAFASNEAKESLVEWLKVREGYIDAAVGKSHLYTKPGADKEKRLFPFASSTAYMLWHNALEKADLKERDKTTNRMKLHPHVLRKFFRTRLGPVIPVDVVEALMGHEAYLTDVYRRYSHEQLAAFYLEGEQALSVFGRLIGNEELQQDINTLFRENRELRKANTELKHRIQSAESKLADLEKLIREALDH